MRVALSQLVTSCEGTRARTRRPHAAGLANPPLTAWVPARLFQTKPVWREVPPCLRVLISVARRVRLPGLVPF